MSASTEQQINDICCTQAYYHIPQLDLSNRSHLTPCVWRRLLRVIMLPTRVISWWLIWLAFTLEISISISRISLRPDGLCHAVLSLARHVKSLPNRTCDVHAISSQLPCRELGCIRHRTLFCFHQSIDLSQSGSLTRQSDSQVPSVRLFWCNLHSPWIELVLCFFGYEVCFCLHLICGWRQSPPRQHWCI